MQNEQENLSSDLVILAALTDKDRYRTLAGTVPAETLSPDAAWMLKWFGAYWKAYPNAQVLNTEALVTMMQLRGKLDAAQTAIAKRICEKITQPGIDADANTVAAQLAERKLAGEAARLVMSYQAGDEIDLASELSQLARESENMLARAHADEFLPPEAILDTLALLKDDVGLRLSSWMQGFEDCNALAPGDAIMFAAGVDSGKTSALCSLTACLAEQVAELYGDRPIVWCNNESSVRAIQPRMYSAVLNATYSELQQYASDGTLLSEYGRRLQGEHRVKLINSHGWSDGDIERLVMRTKPAVLVLDMVEHFNLAGGGKLEVFAKVERLWQRFREMAVRHDMVVIGTGQLSEAGINEPYPRKEAVRNSRVGVQGALDLQIMMGDRRADGDEFEKVRWFSAPKNKKRKQGGKPVRFQAYFDIDRCQFLDGGNAETDK